MNPYLPIFFVFVVAAGFVVTTLVVTHLVTYLLKYKKDSAVKNAAFECGIEVVGNARTPFSIKYFLVAILFVLFDVEVIFMYPWAVNFRELGVKGLLEMFTFMAVLFIGLMYIFRRGALKWE